MDAATTSVNGVAVAYRRQGTGPPLLYLHGMGLTRRWLTLYELLSRRFDVIVPEHPGFGGTPRPRWFRSLDDLVLHQADVLTALGVADAHVAGHSLGGRVAGSLAALFPERVRSLTLITPSPLPLLREDPLPLDDLALDAEIDSLLFNGDEASYPAHRDADDDGALLAGVDGDPHADPTAFRLDGTPTLYRRLARYRGPAQILVPDDDRMVPTVHFEDWSHRLGWAPLVPVPGGRHPTGHMLVVQEPGRVADAIARLAR